MSRIHASTTACTATDLAGVHGRSLRFEFPPMREDLLLERTELVDACESAIRAEYAWVAPVELWVKRSQML